MGHAISVGVLHDLTGSVRLLLRKCRSSLGVTTPNGNGDRKRQRKALYSECDAGLGRRRGSNRVSQIIPIQRCCGLSPRRGFENSDSVGRRLERETALLLSSPFQLLVLFLSQLQVYPTMANFDPLVE